MSSMLVAIVGLIYLGICVSLVYEGNIPMAVVFFGYALSNAGFFYAIRP